MTLGQKVRQARIRAGLTQEQAAGGRITRNMLSLIENDLSAPSMKTLEYLAAALGVTAGWLLAAQSPGKYSSDKQIAAFSTENAAILCNLMVFAH